MKFTEEEIKQIILDESKKYLEEIDLARRVKNAGSLSLDTFMSVIEILSQEVKIPTEDALLVYMEIALDLKRNWGTKQWDLFTDQEKEVFLKTTYPQTPRDESEDLLIASFLNPNLAKVIFDDIGIAIEKVADAKKEIKSGKYLGPEEPGGDPKSPHWKEYLEEIIKEEIVNHLK